MSLRRRIGLAESELEPAGQSCRTCGASDGRGGVLIVAPATLGALERDTAGVLTEAPACPTCDLPPVVVLPDNGLDRGQPPPEP